MQAYFRLSNSILDCGLTPNELKVAVCLYSCVFNNSFSVRIRQQTIADKCGIKKIETVGGIICKLIEKGVIEHVSRPYKANGQLGTYIYKLKAIAARGFFKVKRYILGKLSGVQLRMYLFVCRAVTKKNTMWNSFNDIARALQIGRNKVISVIKELVGLGFIRKLKVLKKDGSYSDNHYSVADPAVQERSDKKESPKQASNLFGTKKIFQNCYYDKPYSPKCQGVSCNFLIFYSGVVP